MKKIFVFFVFLLSITMLCSCESNEKDVSSNNSIQVTEATEHIKTTETTIPSNSENIVTTTEIQATDITYESATNPQYSISTENTVAETESYFKPYEINVQRNELSVYDTPGYAVGNWIYDITDRRTITIVSEQIIEDYGDAETWGRLDTGGWVNLIEAFYVEEVIPDTNTEEIEVNEPIATEHSKLEGELIYKDIYGCGNKHTSTSNGIKFIWYDRYEKQNYKNTKVLAYVDVSSFSINYELNENKWGGGEWITQYEFFVSEGKEINFWMRLYDKDDYFLKETVFSNSIYHSYQGKCKGEWNRDNMFVQDEANYAILYPSL